MLNNCFLKFHWFGLLFMLLKVDAAAQLQATGGPDGAYLYRTATSQNYLWGMGRRGVYRSADSGDHWEKMPIEVSDPAFWVQNFLTAADQRVMLAIYEPQNSSWRLHLSPDEGNTWSSQQLAGQPSQINPLALPDGWWAVQLNPEGVFLSDDAGATWEKSTVTDSIKNGGFLSADGEKLFFIGTDTVFWGLPDAGQWQQVTLPAGFKDFLWVNFRAHGNWLAMVADYHHQISKDFGNTWVVEPAIGVAKEMGTVFDGEKIWVAYQNELWLADSSDLVFQKSGDLPHYFHSLRNTELLAHKNQIFNTSYDYYDFDPTHEIDYERWLQRSPDGGKTWKFPHGDLREANIRRLRRSQTGEVFACTPTGLFRQKAGADAWQRMPRTDVAALHQVVLDFAEFAGKWWLLCNSELFFSSDEGANWQKVPAVFGNMLAVLPNALFAQTLTSLFRTIDGGANWEDISANFPTTDASLPVRIYATSGRLFAEAEGNKLFISNDLGNSWLPTPPPDLNSMCRYFPQPDGSIFCASPFYKTMRFYRSTNGGQSFEKLAGEFEYNPNFDFGLLPVQQFCDLIVAHERLYFSSPEVGLFRSTNSGDSWEIYQNDSTAIRIRDLLVADTFVYAGTFDRSIWRLSDAAVPAAEPSKPGLPGFQISPNPVVDKLTFTVAGGRQISLAQVFDPSGKLVFQKAIPIDNQSLAGHELLVGQLPAGAYFLEIIFENGIKLAAPFLKK